MASQMKVLPSSCSLERVSSWVVVVVVVAQLDYLPMLVRMPHCYDPPF